MEKTIINKIRAEKGDITTGSYRNILKTYIPANWKMKKK
jgi:hypothetical protein